MLPKNASLRHVALAVHKIDECEKFYHMLGMKTELKTQDYVYLSGNGDNISLHRIEGSFSEMQRLEHIGFALDSIESVDALYEKIKSTNITVISPPKTFGIGTHSFSVSCPDGIEVEFTYHPPIWEHHD